MRQHVVRDEPSLLTADVSSREKVQRLLHVGPFHHLPLDNVAAGARNKPAEGGMLGFESAAIKVLGDAKHIGPVDNVRLGGVAIRPVHVITEHVLQRRPGTVDLVL
jgi:hypothetical protein